MRSHRESDGRIDKMIVAFAPVAHEGTFLPPAARNPLTPDEIADEARACADEGASVVHLHVRDPKGTIVVAMEWFTATLDRITAETDLIVNGSTGGASALTREERCVTLADPRVELASLNMGSTNLGESVYINTVDDIRFWADRIRDAGVIPELEVFAPGMISTSVALRDEGVLPTELHFNVCLGFPGATPADPRELAHMVSVITTIPNASWGFLHEGMTDLRLTAAAIGMGARVVRVGYEDGGYLRRDRPARSNVELVRQLVGLVRDAGLEPASPEEARVMLGTKGRRE